MDEKYRVCATFRTSGSVSKNIVGYKREFDRYAYRGKAISGEGFANMQPGEWLYGAYVPCGSTNVPMSPSIVVIGRNGAALADVDPATVGVCTNLTADVSHRGIRHRDLLIFEGDIIKDWYGEVAVVTWGDHELYLRYSDGNKPLSYIGILGSCHAGDRELEIIGNIHEHSHLIESGV